MAKIKAVQDRLFKNIFVCKNCGTKIRADSRKIIEKKIKCRRCGKKEFRTKKKK
jgi:DNA-directed RNA polymerase subunit RPC12/RpoP